jgi:hypothetical protein
LEEEAASGKIFRRFNIDRPRREATFKKTRQVILVNLAV